MKQRTEMRAATIVIALVLGLQSVALVLKSDRWGWPFTDYPMFSASHHDGEIIDSDFAVYATTTDGREIELTAENLNIDSWLHRKWARRLTTGQQGVSAGQPDSSDSAANAPVSTRLRSLLKSKNPDLNAIFLERAEQRLDIDIAQLRVEGTPYRVTREGMVPAPRVPVLVDVSAR
jgi:hypothetical protein